MTIERTSMVNGARPNGGGVSLRSVSIGLAFCVGAILLGSLALELTARIVLDRNGMHYGIELW